MIINQSGSRKLLERGGALHRHWPWIVAAGIACATGALIVSLFLPKMYRATTYVLDFGIEDRRVFTGTRISSRWRCCRRLSHLWTTTR